MGLAETQLEPGDYLLDWRRGGYSFRYAHHFSQSELAGLAEESGFQISEAFFSDGQGGNLAIYETWEPIRPTYASSGNDF